MDLWRALPAFPQSPLYLLLRAADLAPPALIVTGVSSGRVQEAPTRAAAVYSTLPIATPAGERRPACRMPTTITHTSEKQR